MEKHLAVLIEQIRDTQGGEVPKGGLIMNSKLKELIRRSEARLMARLPASRLIDAMTPRKLRQMQTLIAQRLAEPEAVKPTTARATKSKTNSATHASRGRRKVGTGGR